MQGVSQQWTEPRDLKWNYIISIKRRRRRNLRKIQVYTLERSWKPSLRTVSGRVGLRPVKVEPSAGAEFRPVEARQKKQNLDYLGLIPRRWKRIMIIRIEMSHCQSLPEISSEGKI